MGRGVSSKVKDGDRRMCRAGDAAAGGPWGPGSRSPFSFLVVGVPHCPSVSCGFPVGFCMYAMFSVLRCDFRKSLAFILGSFRRLIFGRAVVVVAGFERGSGGPTVVRTFGACFIAVYLGV